MIYTIKVDMGIYEHYALVSDRVFKGKPMLISNTQRNGTVVEESWDKVVAGRAYKLFRHDNVDSNAVLSKARALIGRVKYDLFRYNCEHFVRGLISGKPTSKQIRNASFAMLSCSTLVMAYLVRRNRW